MHRFLGKSPLTLYCIISGLPFGRWRYTGAIHGLSFAVFDGFLHLHDVTVECIATLSITRSSCTYFILFYCI